MLGKRLQVGLGEFEAVKLDNPVGFRTDGIDVLETSETRQSLGFGSSGLPRDHHIPVRDRPTLVAYSYDKATRATCEKVFLPVREFNPGLPRGTLVSTGL